MTDAMKAPGLSFLQLKAWEALVTVLHAEVNFCSTGIQA